MTPGENPHIHDTTRTLQVKLPGEVSAKLATFRRQEQPEMTDEQAAAYLIRDSLVRLGLLELPAQDRGSVAVIDGEVYFVGDCIFCKPSRGADMIAQRGATCRSKISSSEACGRLSASVAAP